MGKRKHNTDRISAISMLIFSALFLWQLKYIHSPLDVIFPRTILLGMMTLSIILLVKSIVKPDPGSLKDIFDIKNRGKVAAGILGIFLWLILIPFIGFAVASVLALIVLSIFLGTELDRAPMKLVSTVVVASVIVFLIYYFFSEFMEVQLPKGILF